MGPMDKGLFLACAVAAMLAGCASPRPDTTAMGAAPGCDLSVDVRGDHRCAVAHVTPTDPQSQLARDMYQFELHSAPHR